MTNQSNNGCQDLRNAAVLTEPVKSIAGFEGSKLQLLPLGPLCGQLAKIEPVGT